MAVNDFKGRILVNNSDEEAWHSIGFRVKAPIGAVKGLKKFPNGIPEFEVWEDFARDPQGKMHSTEEFRIVRKPTKDDQTNRVIGFCTKGYHMVQPMDIAIAFDDRVGKPIETIGFLGKGERMFLTWALPKSQIVVVGDDVVKMYGTVLAGFDAKVSIYLSLSTFRVVCGNTYRAALDDAKTKKSEEGGAGRVWSGRHNNPDILKHLGAWMAHIQMRAEERAGLLENLFQNLASIPVKKEAVLKSVVEAVYETKSLGDIPVELREKKQREIDAKNAIAIRDQSLAYELFNGKGIAITPTAWGLFNVFTEIENHHRDSKKDPISSVVFGGRSETMNKALNVITAKLLK